MFKAKLLPRIEAVLDKVEVADLRWYIPRLEVDLAKIRLKDEAAILETFEEELTRQLMDIKQKRTSSGTRKDSSQSLWEGLLSYLKNGFFTWNFPFNNLVALENKLLEEEVHLDEWRLKQLYMAFEDYRVFQRFAFQSSPLFFNSVFTQIIEKKLIGEQRNTEWAARLTAAADQQEGAALKAEIIRILQEKYESASSEYDEAAAHGSPVKSQNKADEIHRENKKSSLYFNHAGLILIAPFLPAFFKAARLVENNEFISEAAKERAVHLLYFLATGLSNPPEEETVFFKFLCGLDFSFPLQKEVVLEPSEKKEAEHLLASVIGHWTKLKKTSANGLREGFFHREGKLVFEREQYHLIVEQKGIDVLLGYLPWGISIIKLPWLNESIRVDWA
jgi:hypothetical protein